MHADNKRKLENELMAMGLPALSDPALIQVMADVVNGYPMPSERVEFFCELLNQCDGQRRYGMYEAMKPRLSFQIPTLDACEARIADKAARMSQRRGIGVAAKVNDLDGRGDHAVAVLECGICGKVENFEGWTTADAMLQSRKAGWGRGPRPGWEHCVSCRLITMPVKAFGEPLTKRFPDAAKGAVN